MSLPEGWEWLDEIPPSWSPPADFSGPTGHHHIDLIIRMLSSNSLGNDLIDLIGQYLSETARFNIWFASEAKVGVDSMRELAGLTVIADRQLQDIYGAWARFIDAYEESGRKSGTFDSEEDLLRRALQHANATLSITRSRIGPAE